MSVNDIHPREHLPLVIDKFKAQARGEITVAMNIPCLRKDGTVFFADIKTNSLILNNIPCNLGFFSDITDRLKADEALRTSEAKYRNLVQNIPGMVYRAQVDWDADFISNCKNVTGYTGDEIKAREGKWLSIVHPGDVHRVSSEGAGLASGKMTATQTYRIITKQGTVRWIEDHKVSLFTENGIFDGIEGFVLDITDRKENETALKERQVFIEALIESLQDGLAVFDRDGKRFMVNGAYIRMTGFSREELLAERLPDNLWPPDERESISRAFASFLKGEMAEKEVVLMRKSGERFPVIITPSYMKDEFGNVIYYVAAIKDITDRRRMITELRRIIQDKEILMVELQHRVKNSLVIIQSLLSMEMDNLSDEGSREVFQNIMGRIQSMSAIYEQLYSSASLNRVDLRDYLQEITRNLIVTYAPDPKLIRLVSRMEEVSLDLKRSVSLGLIINELVTNIIKYAYPAGTGGEIGITLEEKEGKVSITISDRGKGLKELMDRQKSKGIGMHLVTLLIDQLEGSLSITGDHGTRAHITFPL